MKDNLTLLQRELAAYVESKIAYVAWLNGDKFVQSFLDRRKPGATPLPSFLYVEPSKATVCLLVTQDGWVEFGYSVPAKHQDYNQELGEQLAYKHAFTQLQAKVQFAVTAGLDKVPTPT